MFIDYTKRKIYQFGGGDDEEKKFEDVPLEEL